MQEWQIIVSGVAAAILAALGPLCWRCFRNRKRALRVEIARAFARMTFMLTAVAGISLLPHGDIWLDLGIFVAVISFMLLLLELYLDSKGGYP